jgi:hypothetical protein
MLDDPKLVRMSLRGSRRLRWIIGYLVVMLVWGVLDEIAPGFCRRVEHTLFAPFGIALQLTIVMAALLPVIGLAWFTWHLFFRRRVRLQKLRRIRVRQGRSPNPLAPPPLFGAACKKADDAINRDTSE